MAILYNDEGKPITKANPLPVSFEDAAITLPPGSVVFPDEMKAQLADETGDAFGTAANPLVTQINGSTVEDGRLLVEGTSGLLGVQNLTSSFGSFTAGQSKNIVLTVPPGCSQITFLCRSDAAFGQARLRHGTTLFLEEPVVWLDGLLPNMVSRRMTRLTNYTELRLVAGSSPVTPTEIRAFYWRDDVANQVQLTGSLITDVDGLPAIRSKQVALGHVSFDLLGEQVVTIAAGATVQDSVSQHVNGFSSLSVIGKGIVGGREQVKVEARWQSTPGFVDGDRSVLEDVGIIPDVSPYSLVWSGETRSQHVFLRAQNQGGVDAIIHLHGMLRV